MVDHTKNITIPNTSVDPWLIWFTCFVATLIFISLFVVTDSFWHIGMSVFTVGLLWLNSKTPFKTMGYILGLVLFLASLQIIFSPFMRGLLLESLQSGFHWSDWRYLLIAVERFAWPLALVSSFQGKLSNPAIIAQLTTLLSPLEWLGFQVSKLQTLVVLSLRFIPALKMEWERFARFQLYFIAGAPRRSYLQKLKFWQVVFKAMISHTVQRSMTLGDLLAIRGLPGVNSTRESSNFVLLCVSWLNLGIVLFALDTTMVIIWAIMTLWLALVSLASRPGVTV